MHKMFRADVVGIGTAVLLMAVVGLQGAQASTERAEQLVKVVSELEADSRRGATLYRAQCASCHGRKGQGNARTVVPTLAGQRRAYLIKQLADFVELERNATQMHAVAARAPLSEPQSLADVAGYLSALRPLAKPQRGSGEMVSLGEASYRQWCASCHEEDARGDDEGFVPSLRNQHYAYLLKEMRALAGGHRFNVDLGLVIFLDSLDADEMSGLADYLSRMSGPVRDRARLLDDGSISE